ncbi:MORN repeat-containing protein [Fusibacter ferrireducens]|uniref:Antitoxin component YwqK of the YwqJK toxin-antitoxin module n=1 Tax=Fusibacter ferrireducens TaxID=2785058 RepID=A0ABR9ZP02_9FIRM|nr:hypothetical protein [Fusibacter ferrireducens]MBF4692046.1 hypothetical protein [Fusibacter ferrireducens]
MGNLIKYMFKTAKTAFLRPLKLLKRKLKKSIFLKSKVGKVIKTSVKDTIGVLKRAPEQKSDYVLIGNKYYAKRLLIVSIVLFSVLIALSQTVIIPFLRGRLYTPTLMLADPLLETYTGKVKLVSRSGVLVYEGRLANGKCQDSGIQYDDLGNLVYRGQFTDDLYSGEGALYAQNGDMIYKGQFENNTFNGIGTLHQSNRSILYEGTFENGLFSGSGKLYNDKDQLIYAGAFSQGLQNGYGVSYFDSGMVQYTGNFLNGKYHGEGTLMTLDGLKLYSGQFAGGAFEGTGKLFFSNGQRAYEGNFSSDQYDGFGQQYSEKGKLIYRGDFALGYYSGEGKQYDTVQDNLVYDGTFDKSLFNGMGTYYIQNEKIYTGEWLAGDAALEGLLGLSSSDVRQHFLESGEVIQLENYYVLSYPKAQCDFYFSYPTDVTEPILYKIVVKAFNLTQKWHKGMSLDDVKSNFDHFTASAQNIDGHTYFVLQVSQSNAQIHFYFDFNTLELIYYEYETPVGG